VAALSSSRDEVAHSPCVRASNITTREYCNKLLLLKQLDALRDLLKQVSTFRKMSILKRKLNLEGVCS
jgi:hypothetical protein